MSLRSCTASALTTPTRYRAFVGLCTRWLARFPVYIDDFELLEVLAPQEDREILGFLTEHEHAALRFLELEVGEGADAATRARSEAELVAYLQSDPRGCQLRLPARVSAAVSRL